MKTKLDKQIAKAKKEVEEENKTVDEEIESIKEELKKQSNKRIDHSTKGSLIVIASYVVMILSQTALDGLTGKDIITNERLMLLMSVVFLYAGIRLFVQATNWISLKLQNAAIVLDQKELVNETKRKNEELKTLQEKKRIAKEELSWLKSEERKDKKLEQDLTLRVPFFERSHIQFMKLFENPDAVLIKSVAPTFVEAVQKMDDNLSKRTDDTAAVDRLKTSMEGIVDKYEIFGKKVEDLCHLMDDLITRQAQLTVKTAELDLGLDAVQKSQLSMSKMIDYLVKSTGCDGDKVKIIEESGEHQTSGGTLTPPPK